MRNLYMTLLLTCGLGIATTAQCQNIPLKTVKARTIELQVPWQWKTEESPSETRVAQLSIPASPKNAQLVVFYFGGPTGGLKRNVDRWVGQFYEKDLKLKIMKGESKQGRYLLVDTQGTWKRPDGPPFAQKTVTTPNSRVINIVLQQAKGPDTDYYFIKLSGHEDVISKYTETIRTAIGASIDKETEVKQADLK